MHYVIEAHEQLAGEMVTLSTYKQLAWFIELPPEARTLFLCAFASAGSKGHFQIGFSNFVAKGFYDILASVNERMNNGEWIKLEDEKSDLIKQVEIAREKSKRFREDISKITKELTEKFKDTIDKDDVPLTPEEEAQVKDLLSTKFKNNIQSGGGLMLVDDAELTDEDITKIKKLLRDKIKFIGKVKLTEDGSIDQSSLQF